MIDLCNHMENNSHSWKITGWNDDSGTQFEISIDLDAQRIRNETEGALDLGSFLTALWTAGIVPAENENDVADRIECLPERSGPRIAALALDTNLLYFHFYPNYMRKHNTDVYDQHQHLLVLCAATVHEVHYKLGHTIRSKAFISSFIEYSRVNTTPFTLLTGRNELKSNPGSLLRQIQSRNGRLGIRGLREQRLLQSSYPTILSSPSHLYYSERIQNSARFVDAIFDSLIRREVLFLRNNTNLQILFLTADKHQYQAANNEGIDSMYVRPPTHKMMRHIHRNITLRNVAGFIEHLLVLSPVLRIECEEHAYWLASTWIGMGPADAMEGKIAVACDGSFGYVVIT
ncbi:MAG: hypothetical protein DRO93_06765 [Candidatus Thorarchaeota archaeon]|nr:MAG: hypothetical protein DRO93_06765 [Candidatus Thorarchaeota archaeon]